MARASNWWEQYLRTGEEPTDTARRAPRKVRLAWSERGGAERRKLSRRVPPSAPVESRKEGD
jgi:hypothetical protein